MPQIDRPYVWYSHLEQWRDTTPKFTMAVKRVPKGRDALSNQNLFTTRGTHKDDKRNLVLGTQRGGLI